MDSRTQIWLPLGLNPANRQNRGNHYLYLIGRLKDGISESQAKAELTALIQNWGERVGVKRHVFSPPPPPGSADAGGAGAGHVLQMTPVQDEIVGSASRTIWVLQAAVGFVLLIACANLASLLLARAEARARELAVRTALGAGRGRLLRQFITEGVLLSLAGGAVGLLVARAGLQALVRWYPDSLPRTSEVTLDSTVLLFTLAVSIATGVVFGLAPLMQTRVRQLAAALKEGARGASGAARHHVRRGLVMAEVAMAVMLVVGAGLLLRTVYNLSNGRRRVRSVEARHLLDLAARGQLPAGARPGGALPAPARAASRRGGRPGGVGHVGPAAEPPGERERHRDRQLHGAARGPVRERRLLPERDDRVLRDDGHSHRAGPRIPARRRHGHGHGGGRERNARQDVLDATATRSDSGSGPAAATRFRGSPSSASPRTSSRAASIRRRAPSSTSSSSRRPTSPAASRLRPRR